MTTEAVPSRDGFVEPVSEVHPQEGHEEPQEGGGILQEHRKRGRILAGANRLPQALLSLNRPERLEGDDPDSALKDDR